MCLGIPGRIVEIRDDAGLSMGTVDFGGVRREVCLAYVADEVEVGDYAVVHVGFALSRIDEAEARRTFEALKEMSQLDELEWMEEVADRSLALADTGASPATPTGGPRSEPRGLPGAGEGDPGTRSPGEARGAPEAGEGDPGTRSPGEPGGSP